MRISFFALTLLLLAGPAQAASISVTVGTDNSACSGISTTCAGSGGVFSGTSFGSTWNTSVGAAGNVVGVGSTSTTMAINAMSAIDGGGDNSAILNFNHTYTLNIAMDNALDTWTVDLNASILGISAFRGDGTASAVGNQQDGSASISTVVTNVNGTNYNIAGFSDTEDCANTCQKQEQFSNSIGPTGILSGTGSASFAITVDFDLTAFTNDGCNGFICSSISGGEEAGLLFGAENAMDQAVDNYSTWGRAIGPDGYNSTWTLNVTSIPTPSASIVVAVGLLGLAVLGSRRG